MLLETLRTLVSRFKGQDSSVEEPASPEPITFAVPSTTNPSTNAVGDSQAIDRAHNPVRILPSTAVRDAPAESFFNNAHSFVINNPNMVSHIINSGRTVTELLAEKRMPGAEVDSSARDPPPRCHPDTRLSLRYRIREWFSNPQRHWKMLWIMGPAGVGKTAVAQTIAEEFKASGCLGAAFFFSRLNDRNDPDLVIVTLAYQLAIQLPDYKRALTLCLVDDSTILEKSRRSQFNQLIVEPFRTLVAQGSPCVQQPLLILLDGLDECESKEAQCEFIELISEHARSANCPVLWMICSRFEWHFRCILSQPDFHIHCKREELLVDDTEAQRDVACHLQQAFYDIRLRYCDRLDANWPPEAHLRQIAAISLGLFALAETLVKFVGDKVRSDPSGQLDICMKFLGGAGAPLVINPLHALDLLYRQILSEIPAETLPTTFRILGFLVLYSQVRLTTRNLANFLCLDRTSLYRSLQGLHSVLQIPHSTEAHEVSIRFYHASFGDFLRDSRRSGNFSINHGAVHHDVAIHSLRWHKRAIQVHKAQYNLRNMLFPELKWIGTHFEQENILKALTKFSAGVGWIACCRVTGDDPVLELVAELESFDFSSLREVSVPFLHFLHWLYTLGERNNDLAYAIHNDPYFDAQDITRVLFVHPANGDVKTHIGSLLNPGLDFYQDMSNTEVLRFHVGREGRSCIVEIVTFGDDKRGDSLAYDDIL